MPIYFAIKWLGWIYGIAALVLVFYGLGVFLSSSFGLHHASGMDTFFLGDDERNYANIISFIRTERFVAKEVRGHWFDRNLQFYRNRSKLVKFLGTWWYKEIPIPDLNKQKEKIIQVRDGIHNEKQLTEFMAKEQSIRDPIDSV